MAAQHCYPGGKLGGKLSVYLLSLVIRQPFIKSRVCVHLLRMRVHCMAPALSACLQHNVSNLRYGGTYSL